MIDEQDIPFILYNNRSLRGVTARFFPYLGLDPFGVVRAERVFRAADRTFPVHRMLEVDRSDLALDCRDVSYGPADLALASDLVSAAHEHLLNGGAELEWLSGRGVDERAVRRYGLGSLHYVGRHASERELDVLGISLHPMLSLLMRDDLDAGGVLFPLYGTAGLMNLTVRRISDVGKLKYTQSCPELHVWGVDDGSGPVWVCEGLFDMMALHRLGQSAVIASSAMWSVPQLMQLEQLADDFCIFADNDKVGIRSAAVLQSFLIARNKRACIYVSSHAKDPAEHVLEMGLGLDCVKPLVVTPGSLEQYPDQEFNFTRYLKNRRF